MRSTSSTTTTSTMMRSKSANRHPTPPTHLSYSMPNLSSVLTSSLP